MAPTQSYKKVQYDLRPAKQVERRMLLDAFLLLSGTGFPIQDYQYTGMGSMYFVDFIMFYRYLGIDKLVSVEYDETAKKRVNFNKPLDHIGVEFCPIGEVIPGLSRDRNHILWLDYDDYILSDHLEDVASAATVLPSSSVLLVTVDAEFKETLGAAKMREIFEENLGEFFPHGAPIDNFEADNIPSFSVELIASCIQRVLTDRGGDMEFVPLFNFLYADGHRMLTMGGMFVNSTDKRRLEGSKLFDRDFIRRSFSESPFTIEIPKFTAKERMLLDSVMPCPNDFMPQEFETTSEDIIRYRGIHRYLPRYFESLT